MALEDMLQSTITRIHAILAELRKEEVTAAPARKLTLERRIREAEGTVHALDDLLAGIEDLLRCCRDAEQEIRRQIEQEIRMRAAHAESGDEAERVGYEQRIEEARALRDAIAREQLQRALRALDFEQRYDLQDRLDAERLALVHVQGDELHGLYWLCHRLLELIPSPQHPPLHHSFAGPVDQTLPGLLSGLQRQLRLRRAVPAGDPAAAVRDEIGKIWQRQSVVLVLDHVEQLDAAGLSAILDALWSPLVNIMQAGRRPPGRACLVIFLLHHTDAPGSAPHPESRGVPPRGPIRMALRPFEERHLREWVNAHRLTSIPRSLCSAAEQCRILDACRGVPYDVVDELCRAWPCDLYTGSDILKEWSKL